MMHALRRPIEATTLRVIVAVPLVLAAAHYLGERASWTWLYLLVMGLAGLALLRRPPLGLPALVVAALALPLTFGTGTEVSLNVVTLLIPMLTALWMLSMVNRKQMRFALSSANRPLLLFLLMGLLSLLIGLATWDPTVPRGSSFTLVQLAQWAIFAFSALAFWLTANLVTDERWLRMLTWTLLLGGGGLALLTVTPGLRNLVSSFTTVAFIRAPFWTLLVAMAAGQLLFHKGLSFPMRAYLLLVLGSGLVYAFVIQQEVASNWIGLVAALGMLFWLRFPRLRLPIIVALVAVLALGGLLPSVYEFAGGDAEWDESGASRLVLIERVVEVTMRNPITGLGPAAYRPYANMKPLGYGRAYWLAPQINSHNNYVDLFAHVGLVGLAILGWFTLEVAKLGGRLRRRYTEGFAAGYVNGALAVGGASLALMMFADWILPFVYNIGFPGFQASVLVWLFLGGLVALDNMPDSSQADPTPS